MKHILPLIFILNGLAVLAQAPDWQWAKKAGSLDSEYSRDIAVDSASGSVYICGSFKGDLSAYYDSSFSSAYGNMDGFVVKYSPDGDVVWALKIGGTGDDEVSGIATDPTGNIYITGYFRNTAEFKGTSGSSATLTSAGNEDIFIAKYNTDGVLQWLKQGANTDAAAGAKIAAGKSGVYIIGSYKSSLNFSSLPSLASQGSYDAFVAGFDFNGAPLFITGAGKIGNDFGYDIAAGSSHIYIIGTFSGSSMDFFKQNLNVAATLTNTGNGKTDIFYAKYNSNTGSFMWAQRIGSSNNDYGYGIAIDADSVYLTGGTSSSADFPVFGVLSGQNGIDGFIAKADKSSGNIIWAKALLDGSGEDGFGRSIAAANGKVYVSGEFYATTDFGGQSLTSFNNADGFLAHYQSDGTLKWIKQLSGNDDAIAYGTALSPRNEIYVTGTFRNDVSFDTDNFTATGSEDIFIAKTGCPASGQISGTTQICPGSSATLDFAFTGTAPWNFTYSDGTNNYDLTSSTASYALSIFPAVNTTYTVIAVTDSTGCNAITLSGSAAITIFQLTDSNSIASGSTLCAGESYTLTGSDPTGGNGSYTYQWQQSSDSVNWSTASGTYDSRDYATGALNTTTHYRRIVYGNCTGDSLISNTLTLQVLRTISNNIIASSQEVCSNNLPQELVGSAPTGGSGVFTYLWEESFDGFSWYPALGVNNLQNYLPDTLSATMWFRRIVTTLDACAFVSYSDSIKIKVNPAPSAQIYGSDTICSGSSSALTISFSGNAPWSISYNDGTNTFSESNITDSLYNLNVKPMQTSVYTLSSVTDNFGCSTEGSGSADVIVYRQPVANAGSDQSVCGLEYGLAPVPSVEKGHWIYPSNIYADTDDKNKITAAAFGAYTLQWVEEENICYDTVSITVTFYEPLTATEAGEPQELDFIYSAELSASAVPISAQGKWTIIEGNGFIEDPENPNTRVTNLSGGKNIFRWRVYNAACEAMYDDVEIIVNDLHIPSGFSPNGDNINDTWVIRGIENARSSELKIMNRWGNEMYSAIDYKNDWDGNLPDDTYFYLLKVNNDRVFTGYVVIKR